MASVSVLQWSFSKILHSLGLSRVSKAFDLIRSKFNEKELRILVTGKAGQGKSALINGLLGAKVAKEGARASRVTTGVETYTKTLSGIPTTVFDSPGLQDRTNNEEEYVKEMSDQCKQLSLVLYCTKMVNTRLTDDDKNAMIKLTRAFGENFWDYAVFVLTFANQEDVERKDDRDRDDFLDTDQLTPELKRQRFQGRVKLWQHELHEFLIKEVGVSAEIAVNIPVVPTGDHKKTRRNRHPFHLPDRDNWFGTFWETCCVRIKETSLFLELCSDRLVLAEDTIKETNNDTQTPNKVNYESSISLEPQASQEELVAQQQQISTDSSHAETSPPVRKVSQATANLTEQAIPVGCVFVKTVITKYVREGYFDVSEIESINTEFGEDLSAYTPSSVVTSQESTDGTKLTQTVLTKPSDTIIDLSSKEPTLKELMDEVAAIIPSQWRNIGIQLDFSADVLSGFDMKYRGDPILCFAAVFEGWKKACEPPYNWTTVIKALESPLVMKIELANVIIKNKFY